MKFKVYCNGKMLEGRVTTVAILYKNIRTIQIRWACLGTDEEYTAYEA